MAWIRETLGSAHVVFSDRHGGVSSGRFATANAAAAVGDDPECVRENRRRIGRALGGVAVDLQTWVRVKAVHGGGVVRVDRGTRDLVVADAVLTDDPAVTLAFRTADCGPLVLAAGSTALVAHVGWRGFAAGVVENAVDAMATAEPGKPITAMLGPTIAGCCYDLPVADAALVQERPGDVDAQARGDGRLGVDIAAGISVLLMSKGVTVDDVGICTSCSDLDP